MNTLSSFLISFCASCIFIGIMQILCPEGNLKSSVKYILSLVFIFLIISAAKLPFNDISFDFAKETYTSDIADDMQNHSFTYIYEQILKSENINFSEIRVFTNKNNDNSISISKVIIYSECEKEKIINALGTLYNACEVEIINE